MPSLHYMNLPPETPCIDPFHLNISDLELEGDFGSKESASMVHTALAVDEELQPDKVKRQMSFSDGKLSGRFEVVEARFLRASFSSFVDILTLASKTIEEFGPKREVIGVSS